jgi:hypothetical protein
MNKRSSKRRGVKQIARRQPLPQNRSQRHARPGAGGRRAAPVTSHFA